MAAHVSGPLKQQGLLLHHLVDEAVGHGGGGFELGVGHEVGDAEVAFVANPGQNRDGAPADRPAQFQIVEGIQVQRRSATAHQHHDVGVGCGCGFQRVHDFSRGLLALHGRREHLDVEAQAPFVPKQVHAEVAKARGAGGAHQRNVLHQAGHGEQAVGGDYALLFQGDEGGLFAALGLAHHGVEVDVFNHQADPKNSVVIDPATEHNLGAGLQDLVSAVAELGLDGVGLSAPKGASHHGQTSALFLLHKVEVDVARGARGQLADFRLEPQGTTFGDAFQRALQALSKLGKGVDGFFSGLRHTGCGVQFAPKVQEARWPSSDTNNAKCTCGASHSRRWCITTLWLLSTRPARSATRSWPATGAVQFH